MAHSWYVLAVEPRAEYQAAGELDRDGFEIFFPRFKTVQPRIGHGDTPLFPGYLFLRCDPASEGWPTFRPAHRVLGWVSFGGEVPCLPDEVVVELKQRSEAIIRDGVLWRRFKPGETVRVNSAGLEGLAEVLEEAKSPQARATVLLEFMGRLVHAQVPWENLRPVEQPLGQNPRPPRRTRGSSRWIQGFGSRAPAGA